MNIAAADGGGGGSGGGHGGGGGASRGGGAGGGHGGSRGGGRAVLIVNPETISTLTTNQAESTKGETRDRSTEASAERPSRLQTNQVSHQNGL